jgi:spore coat polysaccharide biosynthesis predicted glycosyltransferase SpsG
MNKFIFRVESDNQGGMRHCYRCLALANILDRYHITFVMNEYQSYLANILHTSNIKLKTLNFELPFVGKVKELVRQTCEVFEWGYMVHHLEVTLEKIDVK